MAPRDEMMANQEVSTPLVCTGSAFPHSGTTYESLADSLPLSLLIKDCQGRRVFANTAYLRVRGTTLEQLKGKRDEDLFPLDIARLYAEDDERVLREGQSLHNVERTRDAAGNLLWIERIKSPIYDGDGQVVGLQVLFWDVTDRVEAEVARDQERHLLMALLDNIPDSIYFKDLDSRFLRISAAMAEKFGMHDPAAAVGRTDADIFTTEHAQAARQDELEIIRTGKPLVDRTERETWPDAPDSWCLTTKMPLRDGEGKMIGTFGISRDITDLKRSQDALTEARDAADAANRAKSDFLANMSHEIRTPMNAIIGMSDLLAQTHLSDEQRDYVDLVSESADSLLRLLNDILDFSKIEARKLELESIPFSLRELVEKTGQTLSLRAAEKGLSLACRVAPDVPERVQGDPGRLRQILINLIGNAIKFTDEGEVVVNVRLESRQDETLRLGFTVRDTGIGIPPEKQDTVIDAFTQVDESTTRRFGGTGLGLTISRQLAELMNGNLSLESEPGEGTTFHFTAEVQRVFDVTEIAPAAPREDVESSLPACPPMRVLIAEDGLANQHVAVGLLRAAGHQATIASDGREALIKWGSESFDMILMDMHMPVMDGIEATKAIRAEERSTGARVPIIALTAAAMAEDARACYDAGMDAHLCKPIHPRRLQQAMAQFAPQTTTIDRRGAETAGECSSREPEQSSQTSRQAPPPSPDDLSSDAIDLTAATSRIPGGVEGVRRLAQVFQGECAGLIRTLRESVAHGDPAVVQRTAHTLKGSASLFSADRLSDAALALERQAKTGDLGPAPPLLEKVQKEAGAVLDALEGLLANPS